jgi:hypothetical protein
MAIKRKFAVVFVMMLLGLLAYTATKRAPIPTGDAEDYWEFACGIELKKFDGYFPYAHWTGIFPENNGWYYYFYQEHHGRHVFKVSTQALLVTIEEVYRLLESEIESTAQQYSGFNNEEEITNLKRKNERRLDCLRIKNTTQLNYEKFINTVSEESSKRIRDGFFARIEDAKEYREKELRSFQYQLERSKLYWASILFEAIFLPLWWLFSFHGGVFGKYNRKISLRLAFSPLLLFIPHYLGYAPYLFSFGPSGGILYPLFAMLVGVPFGWVPFNPVEIWFLKMLPQPLAYISQIPFSPMAISFKGAVSPTVLLVYTFIVLGISKIWCTYVKKKES